MTTNSDNNAARKLADGALKLAEEALEGPWQLVEEPLEVNELGKERGFTKPKTIYSISTEWIHGQLKTPAPIIWQSYSPYIELKHFFSIEKENAALMAASRQLVPDLATALLSALDRIEQLEKELDQSDRETEHFARLACDDLGKNPPVWWKDKAEELQSRVEQLERVLAAARAFVTASKVDLTRVGSPGFGVVVRAVDERFEELERLVSGDE